MILRFIASHSAVCAGGDREEGLYSEGKSSLFGLRGRRQKEEEALVASYIIISIGWQSRQSQWGFP